MYTLKTKCVQFMQTLYAHYTKANDSKLCFEHKNRLLSEGKQINQWIKTIH